jgi:hypothetical protein
MDELTKSKRIDLGLDLLALHAKPGQRITVDEIAAWADCSPTYIKQVEKTALEKLKRELGKQGIKSCKIL